MGYACCPACSGKRSRPYDDNPSHLSVRVCRRCGAVYGGPVYLGESHAIVRPWMVSAEREAELEAKRQATGDNGVRYFDLECLGSGGLTRRHGWYDTETRLVVQVG